MNWFREAFVLREPSRTLHYGDEAHCRDAKWLDSRSLLAFGLPIRRKRRPRSVLSRK